MAHMVESQLDQLERLIDSSNYDCPSDPISMSTRVQVQLYWEIPQRIIDIFLESGAASGGIEVSIDLWMSPIGSDWDCCFTHHLTQHICCYYHQFDTKHSNRSEHEVFELQEQEWENCGFIRCCCCIVSCCCDCFVHLKLCAVHQFVYGHASYPAIRRLRVCIGV